MLSGRKGKKGRKKMAKGREEEFGGFGTNWDRKAQQAKRLAAI